MASQRAALGEHAPLVIADVDMRSHSQWQTAASAGGARIQQLASAFQFA